MLSTLIANGFLNTESPLFNEKLWFDPTEDLITGDIETEQLWWGKHNDDDEDKKEEEEPIQAIPQEAPINEPVDSGNGVEPTEGEMKMMLQLVPLMPAEHGWDQDLEATVLPMPLDDYMECFWTDEAPYFVPAVLKSRDDKVVNYTYWGDPTLDDIYMFGGDVVSSRTIEKTVHTSLYTKLMGTISTIEHIVILENSPTNVTIMVVQTQSGFSYADSYTEWYKWTIMTPDERSDQVVFRKESSLQWRSKPWVVWRYIESWAVKILKSDSYHWHDFFTGASENYQAGEPYENTTLPEIEAIERGTILDGQSTDYETWKNSWTCWFQSKVEFEVKEQCRDPSNKDEIRTGFPINGDTKVGDTPWNELKREAMLPDYKSTTEYQTLSPDERHLVDALIEAQTVQGNMDYLTNTLYNPH